MSKSKKPAKAKNPHAVALGKLGGANSGGPRPGAGRPKDPNRCPCGKSTMKRAKSRKFDCCRKVGLNP